MKMYKKITAVLLLLMITLALNSCWDSIGCENGSGNIINQDRTITNFNKLDLEGIGNVYITQGKEEKISVETDDNLMAYVVTYSSHGTLYITSEKSICPKKLNIYITVKDINSVKIEGSGNIYINNGLNTNTIDFSIEGSGDIRAYNINAEKVSINIEGSGDVKITGKSYALNSTISGSGDINAIELISNDVIAEIDGSGDIKVSALDRLYAIINGSGDIYYKGNPPNFRTIVNGSGDIRKL